MKCPPMRATGRRCRHNLNYWLFGDYLGAGAGAHGKLTTDAGILRTQQTREPRRYMSTAVAALTVTAVVTPQIPFEFMLNGLRLLDGFSTAEFCSRTGLDWAAVAAAWERGVEAGLLMSTPDDRHWRDTPGASHFLNDALVGFLPAVRGG